MTSGRSTPIPPPARRNGPARRIARTAALTAGAALGIGALAAPFATTHAGSVDAPGTVALAADATPAVSLGTQSVEPGGKVSFTVSGFPAGATLSVKLDDTALLAQFPIGDDGSASGSVTVPDGTADGTHWLRFLAPQTSVRSADLTVATAGPSPTPTTSAPTTPAADPKVKLTSGATVAAGGKVSFSLSGFVKGQTVTVKLDDQDIIGQWSKAVDADGAFSGTVTIPKGTSAGAHWLRILAPDPATSLKADLTVTSSGGSGSGGSSGGSGGSAGGGSNGGSGSGSGGTSGSGGSGSSGGGSGSTAGASARITAGSSVAAGGKVSFRVTGFPAGKRLTVKLDDTKILSQYTIGSDGSFSGSVTVPDGTTKGGHWLRFLAPDPPTSLKADFTVTSGAAAGSDTGDGGGTTTTAAAGSVPAATGAPASATDSKGAKAEITASEVQAGGRLHFKVTKFPAKQTVTIKLDDEAILGQWKADASGAYEGDVTIPAGTSTGAHWLRFLAPNPPTTLKVDFKVTAPGTTAAGGDSGSATSSTAEPEVTPQTAAVASTHTDVSYATIAWSAAAAAVGGAAGAAGTTLFVVRRRPARPADGS